MTTEDCIVLPDELNTVISWFNPSELQFSIDKCQSMKFNISRFIISYTCVINGSPKTKTSCKQDLDVRFNIDLVFIISVYIQENSSFQPRSKLLIVLLFGLY